MLSLATSPVICVQHSGYAGREYPTKGGLEGGVRVEIECRMGKCGLGLHLHPQISPTPHTSGSQWTLLAPCLIDHLPHRIDYHPRVVQLDIVSAALDHNQAAFCAHR